MLAAYLMRTGMTYDTAMQTVLIANPEVELRSAQTDFLRAFAAESVFYD
jgi:hypothetical protein